MAQIARTACLDCKGQVELLPPITAETMTIERMHSEELKGRVSIAIDGCVVETRCFEATPGEQGFVLLYVLDDKLRKQVCSVCGGTKADNSARHRPGVAAEIRRGHVYVGRKVVPSLDTSETS